jgi:hypothetical protein
MVTLRQIPQALPPQASRGANHGELVIRQVHRCFRLWDHANTEAPTWHQRDGDSSMPPSRKVVDPN